MILDFKQTVRYAQDDQLDQLEKYLEAQLYGKLNALDPEDKYFVEEQNFIKANFLDKILNALEVVIADGNIKKYEILMKYNEINNSRPTKEKIINALKIMDRKQLEIYIRFYNTWSDLTHKMFYINEKKIKKHITKWAEVIMGTRTKMSGRYR